MIRSTLLACLLALTTACVMPPPRPAGAYPGGALYGDEELDREGSRLRRLAEERYEGYQQRVERVGRRLLEQMPNPPRVQFVIDGRSRDINAGATFGQVIVTAGLLDFARNDDELAAVLSHELAHLTQGHVTRGVIGSLAVNILAIVVETQAPGLGNTAGGLGQLALNRYTQSQERAADRVGIEAMYGAGYDPRAAADVQERLAVEVPQTMTAGFFDTHPSSVERMVTARKQADQLLARGDPPGRQEVLALERRGLDRRPDRGLDPDGGEAFDDGADDSGFAYRAKPRPAAAAPAADTSLECRRADTYRQRADEASNAADRESLYRRALRYCPTLAAAREGLADVLREQGRRDEASEEMRRAPEIE